MDTSKLLGRFEILARIGVGTAAAIPTSVCIPLALTMRLKPRFAREDALRTLHAMEAWARLCRRWVWGIHLDVEGREHLPKPSRGHMYVSNHQSWTDIPVLMEALGTAAFLSKSMIQKVPLIGRCAYAGGSVFVEREDPASRRKALEEVVRMCRESTAVVVFPEGTRSADGELREKIYPASIRRAYELGLKIVPVGLDGTLEVLPKSMDRVNTGERVAVTIGAPLDPADHPDADAWVKAVWGRVGELFVQSRGRRR